MGNRTGITGLVKTNLWRASGGRCQFNNCNIPLWRHDKTMDEMNKSYIAHIHAVSKNGPRYDEVLSPKLETDFSNLMLVCDECHRLFDNKEKVDEYDAPRLIEMKRAHEERIELLTGIAPDMKSHILLYGARIGVHASPLSYKGAADAILPDFYPSMPRPIEIGLSASFEDDADNYWSIEEENLVARFKSEVEHLKGNHEVQHFSVFGLAPQPLLIKLGTLLNDLYQAEVYQLKREPSTWRWLPSDTHVEHKVTPTKGTKKVVALKFELSSGITNERVYQALGKDCDIWSFTHSSPNNDYLRSRHDLQDFREKMRLTFNQIKTQHGEDAVIHVFPAMPVSAAIELGRVWMPKADLPMIIYDQNHKREGFFKTLEIK